MLAVMWLFSSMCAYVYGEGATLYEGLPTIRPLAIIWSLICVYPVMSAKV